METKQGPTGAHDSRKPHHPAPPRSYGFRRTSQTRVKVGKTGGQEGEETG